VPELLGASQLKVGKTLVIQQNDGYGVSKDFGRFLIKDVIFDPCNCGSTETNIVVYDALHNTGTSPGTYSALALNSTARLYFGYDSVSFNTESAYDNSAVGPFKRYFEVFVDQNRKTFTNERARLASDGSNITVNGVTVRSYSELVKFNFVKVSNKLRGFKSNTVVKTTLHMNSYDGTTGEYDGYLCNYDGVTYSSFGPLTYGKQGTITRFYDQTEIDYIDLIVDINTSVSTFTNKDIDIQLFPSLSLDEELMLIGSCQYSDSSKQVSYVSDDRSFGNTSEKDLSTSAISFITAGDRYLHGNGVVRGFEFASDTTNPDENQFYLNGGVALVNGNLCTINNQTINVPKVNELYSSTSYNITWVLCVNDKSEYQLLPLLDDDYEPTVHPTNISNPNRKFVATNPTSSNTYSLEATTFSNLIKRKDLAPIYLVRSTSAATTLSLSDIRRFVTNVDDKLNLSYASNASDPALHNQCNFNNAEAIFNWLYLNNDFNGTASFRNIHYSYGSDGIVNAPIAFDYTTTTYINGEGNSNYIQFNDAVVFGNNVNIKNINFVFTDSWTVTSDAENQYFENCTFTYETTDTSVTILEYGSSTNIEYNNCTFNISLGNVSTFIALNICEKVRFINCNFNVDIDKSDGVTGKVFDLTSFSKYITFDGCEFNTNAHAVIYNQIPRDITIKNNKFYWTYTADEDPDFDPDNLVNPANGKGCIVYEMAYTSSFNNQSIENIRKNYIIENNEFIFQIPEAGTNERYPFILMVTTISASNKSLYLRNVSIKNNKFQTRGIPLAESYQTKDDFRAAIAIVNSTSPSVSTISTTIEGLEITGNICNRYQMILVSSLKYEGAFPESMTLPGLVVVNRKYFK